MSNTIQKTYSIGDASKITGISQRRLRSLEGKYIPEPEAHRLRWPGLPQIYPGPGQPDSPNQKISGSGIYTLGRREKSQGREVTGNAQS